MEDRLDHGCRRCRPNADLQGISSDFISDLFYALHYDNINDIFVHFSEHDLKRRFDHC